MKILEDQSKNRRRLYKKKTMKERRRKVKDETKERKVVGEHKDDISDTEDNEMLVPEICPICNTKKKNIFLHIKTKKSCFMKIDKQVFEKCSKILRYNTQKAQNRKRDTEKEKKESTSEKETFKNAVKSKSYETYKERQNRRNKEGQKQRESSSK